VKCVSALEEEEDGGFPSGGGYELEIVDGLTQIQVYNSPGHLTRSFRRIWAYPPLYHPLAHFKSIRKHNR
jgi:hypothetical protein